MLQSLVGSLRARVTERFAVAIDAVRTGWGHDIESVVHRGPGQ